MTSPKWEPTEADRALARKLALAGVDWDTIASCIINPSRGTPISRRTLVRAMGAELDLWKAECIGNVAGALFRTAVGKPSGPQVAAACFIMKTQAGWRETTRVESSGIDGGPIEHKVTDATQFTAGEREQLRTMVQNRHCEPDSGPDPTGSSGQRRKLRVVR